MSETRLELRTHPRAADVVARRARVLAALRSVMDELRCVEVDPPSLLPFAGQEPHLHPPRVELPGLPGPLWLQTSPELTLKRLLAAGVPALYALGPAWRGGREELSEHHQPSFTMLEWYRPGASLALLQADVARLASVVAEALGADRPAGSRVLDVSEALRRWAGVDPEPLFDGDLERFAAELRAAGLERARAEHGAEGLLGRALVERVEPALAREPGLSFLQAYPAACAALAELDPADERLSLRTEAYLSGLELANGYVELREGQALARRWEEEARAREGAAPAQDGALLASLRAKPLPVCVGMALGVDRLVLALLGGTHLGQVLPLHLALVDDSAERDRPRRSPSEGEQADADDSEERA
ncbi:MAG: EF-P lysine aminoacylase GenX [Planctomycetota bacterium]|nr:MAG: EF-P lysine aminoacylase GenX [Planctomycetota bacterium]